MTPVLSRLPSRLPSGLPAAARSPRALATAAAALVALAGLVLVLLGLARATVWAPESVTTARVSGQPGAPVVVTTPAATALDGPSLRIDVRGPGDRPVFVGVGRADDVAAYLGAVARIEVTGARDGRAVQTRQGTEGSLPEPTAADVWTESATGRGSASLDWTQVPGRWRVLAAVDGATAPTEVVLTWQRARASSSAPALFAVGGLLLALGVVGALAARRALPPSARPATTRDDAARDRAVASHAPSPAAAPASASVPAPSAPSAASAPASAAPASAAPASAAPASAAPASAAPASAAPASAASAAPAGDAPPARGAPAPGSRRSARLARTGELPRVPAAPERAVDRHRADEPDEPEEPVAPRPFRQPPGGTS
jgi:hypothetical protein